MKADWIRADWNAPAGIVAGTTLRQGGVSQREFASLNLGDHVGDRPEHVAQNRRIFRELCGLPANPAWLRQVHGVHIARNPAGGSQAPEADAVYSNAPVAICAVLTADCLPVLFCSADGTEVAAAHAGWRGLCHGVLEATLAEFSAPGGQIQAWLGPAISQEAFEVGSEVREAFILADPAAKTCFSQNPSGRWQADLYEIARLRLAACGVTAVSGGSFCTYAETDLFFSYRRDGECGRMATFVARNLV